MPSARVFAGLVTCLGLFACGGSQEPLYDLTVARVDSATPSAKFVGPSSVGAIISWTCQRGVEAVLIGPNGRSDFPLTCAEPTFRKVTLVRGAMYELRLQGASLGIATATVAFA
jgi:hypothetical protein